MKIDVIVIGTGFGGAVCAANLARAGLNVCILERGTWWGKSQKCRAFPESLPSLVRSIHSVHLGNRKFNLSLPVNPRGLLEFHDFNGPRVVAGVGVGGSSLVYAGISQRPPADFFDSFPEELTWPEMEPYFQKIEEVLCPSPSPVRTDRDRKFESTALGLDRVKFHPISQAVFWGDGPHTEKVLENKWGKQQANCRFCNHCVPGCNRGSKNSLDLNLIPAALKAGAELRDLCRVDYILRTHSGYEVSYRNLRNWRRVILKAPRVVLAAGTLNTHKILFRSQSISDGLPKISPLLGRHFSMGGDTSKSYSSRDYNFHYGKGHIAEGIIEVFDDVNRSDHFVFPVDFIFGGRISRRFDRYDRDYTLRMVGFGRDSANGQLTMNGRTLELSMPEQEVLGKIRSTMLAISQAYGKTGSAPMIIHSDTAPRPLKVKTSAHPLGGCRMGNTAQTGVVDHRGEVFGYSGLFIADASIFCGPPVCAPSLSIASMSWRISDMIVDS